MLLVRLVVILDVVMVRLIVMVLVLVVLDLCFAVVVEVVMVRVGVDDLGVVVHLAEVRLRGGRGYVWCVEDCGSIGGGGREEEREERERAGGRGEIYVF